MGMHTLWSPVLHVCILIHGQHVRDSNPSPCNLPPPTVIFASLPSTSLSIMPVNPPKLLLFISFQHSSAALMIEHVFFFFQQKPKLQTVSPALGLILTIFGI